VAKSHRFGPVFSGLLALAVSALAGAPRAHAAAEPAQETYAAGPDIRYSATALGDRIAVAPRDGSLRYGESDIEMGATGFALALRRGYSSANSSEGLFGRGWTCLLDRRLEGLRTERPVLRGEWGAAVGFSSRGSAALRSQTGRPQWLLIEKDGALLRDAQGQFRAFDSAGRLCGIYNSAMAGLTIEYGGGRLSEMRDTYGRSIRFKTDDGGRIVEARSAAGHLFQYQYKDGLLTSVSDRDGPRAVYAYDGQGRMISVLLETKAGKSSDADRERAAIRYDGQGRVTRLSGAGVAERAVRYSRRTVPFSARVTEIADAFGHVTRYRFREDARECQVTLPDGAVATVGYGERHLPARIELPQDRRILLRYDEAGNLTRVILPGGASYGFGWSGRGDLVRWTRTDGATFAFDRSETGSIRAVRGPRREDVRRLAFDARGRLASLADGAGRAILFSYNASGDLMDIGVQGSAQGVSVRFDHDEAGRLARVAPPGRPALAAEYGDGGLPNVLSGSVGYRLALERDRQGRLSAVEDGEGHREQIERGLAERARVWRRPDGAEVRLACDAEGNLVQIRLPEGNESRFAYDERNLATSETSGVTRRRVQYDEFGHVVLYRDALGRSVRLFYDPAGRLVEVVREPQDIARLQNSLDGQVLRMADHTGEYRFGNDTLGRPARLAGQAKDVLPGEIWAEYTYDDAGRVAALATTGGRWTRQYDSQGRLVRLAQEGEKAVEVRYAYENDQAYLPTRVFLPGGTNLGYAYDPYGRVALVQATLPSGKSALAERYAYDGRGNILRVESSGRRLDFEYDPQNRLVAQQLNGHVYARLSYGRDGRLVKMEGEEGTLELVYDAAGRPIRSSLGKYEYDAAGNRVAKTTGDGVTRYRFDALGRLVGVTLPSGFAITRAYAANGWPISRSSRVRSAAFFFVGDLPLFGWRRGEGGVSWYIDDPTWGGPLGRREAVRTELAYRDATGELVGVGEAGGDAVTPVARGLLGRRVQQGKMPFFDPLSLDALGFDAEEGLSDAYDPGAGLSLVPRSLREGLSAYSAVRNPQSAIGTLAADAESGLLEEIVAACAGGRFAPDEGMMLRYLIGSCGSPGWPDVGSDETFDRVLEGRSLLTPAAVARRLVETVLRDGSGGLPASAFAPHVGLPASCFGLGGFRTVCPTLSILPPVTLESDRAGNDAMASDPAFTAPDNALHGLMARLVARAADRSDVRPGEDGSLRRLGELLEMARWTMHVSDRAETETVTTAMERPAPVASGDERLTARRNRLLSRIEP